MFFKWLLFSVALFSLLPLAGCKKTEIEESKTVTVSITSESYQGGYPAVWFSATRGDIKKVGYEDKVDVKSGFESEWNCWIEPQEPEIKVFRRSTDSLEGISYLGEDDSLFSSSHERYSQLNHRFSDESKFKSGAVFLLRTKRGSSKIKIINYDKKNKSLKFKWRKL